ncbi:hypothetical protein [uncultured Campylobacter sp.]|uniref:hypothetical protein n=1 Tax=uncultured Campylobacter sp. TaxID=218934 RepID=UPI00260966E4|nr:hypothetical protein [uncultured Campylobacter sp.]
MVVKVGISFLYSGVSKQLARDFKVRLKRWNFIKFQIKFGLNFKFEEALKFKLVSNLKDLKFSRLATLKIYAFAQIYQNLNA